VIAAASARSATINIYYLTGCAQAQGGVRDKNTRAVQGMARKNDTDALWCAQECVVRRWRNNKNDGWRGYLHKPLFERLLNHTPRKISSCSFYVVIHVVNVCFEGNLTSIG
jgi:hypothetical protein